MRYLLALILLLPFGLNAATQFTEFYCDYGVGTNINSGSTTNAAATYTSVNGNFNGSSTFTPTDGSTPASTISAGDWAAIYIDGATNLVQSGSGGYIVQVLSVAAGVNGAITVSTTAFAGTAPSSSATGRSIKVGGAWNGPYGSIGFPFGFLATTATNAPNVVPRCNFKNTAQYNVTAAITHSLVGPCRWSGMTTTPGDGGKATIDGGTSGNYYTLFTSSGADNYYEDFIFANNGGTSTAQNGVASSAARNIWRRIVVHDMRQSGLTIGTSPALLIECEVYSCNKANTANHGGFLNQTIQTSFIRCISHDNTGSNNSGFHMGAGGVMINCISESNGKSGIFLQLSATTPSYAFGCDLYNNAASGIDLATTSGVGTFFIENCNFIKNATFGIDSAASLRNGSIINCAFGSGSQTNSSGNTKPSGLLESDSITYTSDTQPWTDPDNGNFRISLTAAKASGRGVFTQSTVNSPTNTVAFPDIGSAQSASTNAAAAGGTTAHTFAQ